MGYKREYYSAKCSKNIKYTSYIKVFLWRPKIISVNTYIFAMTIVHLKIEIFCDHKNQNVSKFPQFFLTDSNKQVTFTEATALCYIFVFARFTFGLSFY